MKNGELLRRASGEFDVFITMDRNLPHQQIVSRLKFGVVLVQAKSNRLADLLKLVPDILKALDGIQPGELRVAGA